MKGCVKISLALMSGVLIAAAWMVKWLIPLAFIAFVPLLYLQDKIGDKENPAKGSVYWLSFLTFLTWNILTTWWIWNVSPAGGVAAIGLNSIFMTTVFWAYHFSRKRLFQNKKGYFILILFVLAFENLHYHWQLNWPWLTLGNVFAPSHSWIQWYSVTGVAGGSLWILASNISIYKLLKHNGNVILTILLLIAPIIIGKIMYHCYEEKGEDVEIVVVQPNIDPFTEEFTLSKETMLQRNLMHAEPLVTPNTKFVVSPESAIQENVWLDNLNRSYSIRKLKEFVGRNKDLAYVIGASTLGLAPESKKGDFAARKFYDAEEYYYSYNSAIQIDSSDSIQVYHKSRLTPGVEMMPSWWFVRPFANMAIDLGGVSGTLKTDSAARVFTFGKYKVAPLICYESVFGGYVTDFVKKGANLLFVITNDGWWGDSPGYRQHLELSKLRAIETRRGIARSANTGISAFINQRGDIVGQTKYWEPTALRNSIKTNEIKTPYVILGDYIYGIASILAIIVILYTYMTNSKACRKFVHTLKNLL